MCKLMLILISVNHLSNQNVQSPLALGISGAPSPSSQPRRWLTAFIPISAPHPHSQGGFAGIKRSCHSSFSATGWRDMSPPWSPAINPAIWHTFVLVLTFSAKFNATYIPSNGIAGSNGISGSRSLRDHHTVFNMVELIYTPTNSVKVFLFLHILSSICCLQIF